jgi:hypothetical protein
MLLIYSEKYLQQLMYEIYTLFGKTETPLLCMYRTSLKQIIAILYKYNY